jgi:hypothetical protein
MTWSVVPCWRLLTLPLAWRCSEGRGNHSHKLCLLAVAAVIKSPVGAGAGAKGPLQYVVDMRSYGRSQAKHKHPLIPAVVSIATSTTGS